MKTIDRYIVRNFLISVGMWFVIMMSLRIVMDLFINMDEFAEQSESFSIMVHSITVYYAAHSLMYFIELGGVIILAGAIASLYVMSRTNELVAMLASGMSLYRVVWPIILCSMFLGGLIIIDREFAIPRVASYLVREQDDLQGTEAFGLNLMTDESGATWHSILFKPDTETMESPLVIVRRELNPGKKDYDGVAGIFGSKAVPSKTAKHGWVIHDAVLTCLTADDDLWDNTPNSKQIWTDIAAKNYLDLAEIEYRKLHPDRFLPPTGKVIFDNPRPQQDPQYGLTIRGQSFVSPPAAASQARTGTLVKPQFTYTTKSGQVIGTFLDKSATWKPFDGKVQPHWRMKDAKFLRFSDLSTKELVIRQDSQWMNYLSTRRISSLISSGKVPDMYQALLTKHIRFADAINNLVMLLLGLPFILSRERNIKASAVLCLLMVAAFYAFIYVCRYMGLSPTLAAWLPVILFGPVSIVMLDSVKT